FFFQAEDGIRDYKVTGVQTCALPIFRGPRPEHEQSPPSGLWLGDRGRAGSSSAISSSLTLAKPLPPALGVAPADLSTSNFALARSEERRVGKECGGRGSPEQ